MLRQEFEEYVLPTRRLLRDAMSALLREPGEHDPERIRRMVEDFADIGYEEFIRAGRKRAKIALHDAYTCTSVPHELESLSESLLAVEPAAVIRDLANRRRNV